MKTIKLLICMAAAAAAFASAKANGQNLTTTYTGIGIGSQVEATWTNGTEVYNRNTGVMTFVGFDAFCVEPFQGLDPGQEVTYQIQDPQSLANYNTIARLVTAYLQSNKTAEDAAAIQWAIWETTSEELLAPSLIDGNIRIMGGAADQNIAYLANGYLASQNSFAPAELTYFKNDTYQDVVSWNVIPEPTSLGLAALSGFFLLRRRRN
jgi:hypothetical protein